MGGLQDSICRSDHHREGIIFAGRSSAGMGFVFLGEGMNNGSEIAGAVVS